MPSILITGASSGLGAEMARQYADLGYDLALCAGRTDRLSSLRDEILAAHPSAQVVVTALDVNDHDAVFRVFEELAEELGGLDKVVVNAGLGKGQPLGTGRFDAVDGSDPNGPMVETATPQRPGRHFRSARA